MLWEWKLSRIFMACPLSHNSVAHFKAFHNFFLFVSSVLRNSSISLYPKLEIAFVCVSVMCDVWLGGFATNSIHIFYFALIDNRFGVGWIFVVSARTRYSASRRLLFAQIRRLVWRWLPAAYQPAQFNKWKKKPILVFRHSSGMSHTYLYIYMRIKKIYMRECILCHVCAEIRPLATTDSTIEPDKMYVRDPQCLLLQHYWEQFEFECMQITRKEFISFCDWMRLMLNGLTPIYASSIIWNGYFFLWVFYWVKFALSIVLLLFYQSLSQLIPFIPCAEMSRCIRRLKIK